MRDAEQPGGAAPGEQRKHERVERLKRRPEFLRVAAARNSAVRPGLVLQARRRDGDPIGAPAARYGLTVSRKVGNAVSRNRARRRLRAAAEQNLPVHGVDGVDYVLIGRRGTLSRPFGALVKDLLGAMRQVGCCRGEDGQPRGRTANSARHAPSRQQPG